MNLTLTGYKTYIIGICILLITIAFMLDRINIGDFATAIAALMGAGFITTRAAIKKVGARTINNNQ